MANSPPPGPPGLSRPASAGPVPAEPQGARPQAAADPSAQLPKWAREIQRFLGVKSQFVLSGNVYDVYPIPIPGSQASGMGTLDAFLRSILAEKGYRLFFKYEPHSLSSLMGIREGEAPEGLELPGPGSLVTLERLARLARDLAARREPSAILVSYASRLPDLCPQEYQAFLYEFYRLSLTVQAAAGRFSLIVWAIDKENDLPPWYRNSRIMHVPVPRPDHDVRRKIIRAAGPVIAGYRETASSDPERLRSLVNRFADQTGGLYAGELVSIAAMAAQDRTDFTRIGDAVRHYKLGVPDNPWDKLDRETILAGDGALSRRVLGQERAVRHSLDIIKRSVFDLSGAQFSPHSQKPKGVLFFAGPTGVGKTELAKGITELVFGSPENYIRFDMSEFNQPHSDQRLMGAPPGYVGYEVGGELTNSVRQRPFTLILFDEIEKAHPRIMDVFLQILDDGRLTSGRGETAYFTDAVIVFTSNLGVYRELPGGAREPLVTQDMDYGEVERRINGAIRDFFTFTLNRPEILNRIGRNIVVFDFIRPGTAEGICRKMIANVIERLAEARRVTLVPDPAAIPALCALASRDLSMGGRGIGNALEECFVNPLSRGLYGLGALPGDRVRFSVTAGEDGSPGIALQKL
ncbi:MAG: AAA family ATPase [Deltaproteobacteria bacterium]|nr:AAA family ATPase [Deltaproteobacteria bacterium]